MVQRGCPAIHRLSVNDVLLHQQTRSPTDNVQEKDVPDKSRIEYGANLYLQVSSSLYSFANTRLRIKPRYEVCEKSKLEFRPVLAC
jgi:hypothetical protein